MSSFSYFVNFVWVLFVLLVIIGCIVVLIKFLSQKNRAWQSTQGMDLLAVITVAPGKSVQLIEVGHSLYLIGVGEDIRLMQKIDSVEEIAAIKARLMYEKERQPFQLSNLLRRRSSPTSGEQHGSPSSPNASFEELFAKQMSQVSDRNRRIEQLLQEDRRND
ncbi:hypothetical protein XYCOK13_14560 [Xylanibacillus composti]|uniref:Flagellar protein n=1 Tax=Xylanibacillus composti TaxID=1572762 RepID=A0A8J4M275_9BACL|nr:flagellar biosynthetic protein FliO [Xylanibacillus composti]GIQ68632.1 hypothetical protein XYCOK13_14560 [Xylanibacillus composti]